MAILHDQPSKICYICWGVVLSVQTSLKSIENVLKYVDDISIISTFGDY